MTLYDTSRNETNLVLTHKGSTVTIYVHDETENLTKNLIAINPPQTTGNQPTDAASASYNMKIIDILNKVERRLTLIGTIDSDSVASAKTKRTTLTNMFLAGGLITITTYGGTFDGLTCAIDKLEFKNLLTDNTSGDGIAEYQVTISLLLGSAFG